MFNDPIADLLTRIRNANKKKHKSVSVPYSKIKNEIVKILKNEGYIIDFKIDSDGIKKNIIIFLKYKGNQRVITGLKRISKPSFDVYTKSKNIPRVLSGYGIAIISTSEGIMTDANARKKNLGGKLMALVW